MTPRFILSHALAAAALLSAWLLYESLANNRTTLQMVAWQDMIQAQREELNDLRSRLASQRKQIESAGLLANSIGPAILADLVGLSADRGNPAIAALLEKHGLGKPAEQPNRPSMDFPSNQ